MPIARAPTIRRHAATFLAAWSVIALASTPASAATYTWLGASNVTWATTTNWSSGTPAGTGDTAVFSGTTTSFDTNIDIGSGITVNSILFTGGTGVAHSITAGSGSVTINDGGSISLSLRSGGSNKDQTISRPIALSGSATFSNFNMTGPNGWDNLYLSGAITGSDVITITGATSNASFIRVTVDNTSTFTGSWDVRSGYLRIYSAGGLGNASVVTLSGGVLGISGVTAARPITWASSAAEIKFPQATSGISSDITMNANVSGTISTGGGNSGIQISGRILGDATNNVTVNHGGTTATFTLGGAGSNTASGTYSFITPGTYVLAKTGGATAIAGNLAVTPNATGTAIVRWDQSDQIADTSIVTLNSSTISRQTWLRLNGKSDTIGGLVSTSTANVVENSLNSGTGTLTFSVASGKSYTFAGLLRNGTSATPGVLAIGMAGSGTQVLSGSNTFSGGATIQGGVLQITNASALGTGTATVSAGTLDLGGLSTVANAVVLSGGTLANGTLAVSQLTATSGAVSASLTGGALSKSGAGTLALSGSNDYSGGLTLSAGVLNVNGSRALGTGTFTITGGTVGNTSGSTVTNVNANPQAWNGNFAFAGTSDLDLGGGAVALGANRIVTVSANTLTVGGSIGGGFGLTKAGAGTLGLSGASGYTGPTTISGGTLALGSGGSIASSSSIIVGNVGSSGAVLDVRGLGAGLLVGSSQTIGGTGSILGNMTIASGATLAPGNSPGILAETGTVTWGGGGNYNWQIYDADAGAGIGWDLFNVTGSLVISATNTNTFKINAWSLSGLPDTTGNVADFDGTQGYTWTIATFSDGIAGFDANFFTLNLTATNGAGGFTNPFGGSFTVAQSQDLKSIQIVYVTVPEPGAVALAGIGLLAAGWSLGRRRKRS